MKVKIASLDGASVQTVIHLVVSGPAVVTASAKVQAAHIRDASGPSATVMAAVVAYIASPFTASVLNVVKMVLARVQTAQSRHAPV